ncbi:hypothetical protein Barb6XT_01927 [Bacteroidales bacterium Barb6XT]|nr:hypothetical protein Barb6XT_01927 [Bacteroidales bacterium Barb6XT]
MNDMEQLTNFKWDLVWSSLRYFYTQQKRFLDDKYADCLATYTAKKLTDMQKEMLVRDIDDELKMRSRFPKDENANNDDLDKLKYIFMEEKTACISKEIDVEQFEFTLIRCAISYFCHRGTIASASFPAELIENRYDKLAKQQKNILLSDLKYEADRTNNFFGHNDCDNNAWQKLLSSLDEDNHYNVRLIDDSVDTVFEMNGTIYPLQSYLKQPHRGIFIPKENIIEHIS